jgi:hypothetical protein
MTMGLVSASMKVKIPTSGKTGQTWGTPKGHKVPRLGKERLARDDNGFGERADESQNPHFWQNRPDVGHPRNTRSLDSAKNASLGMTMGLVCASMKVKIPTLSQRT